ncbi:MAG: InlB B-repeat-containing protein [Oscillospiraceae bacterium]|nr:InlB B-repeat-containing protein [Oscillospiraceae bacterium]
MNPSSPEQNERTQPRELKGLYKGVKVSVKTLDIVIVLCVLAIVLFVAVDLQSPGFTVSFDPNGGTDVPAQTQMYGEALKLPQPPTREGYSFTGWYKDPACFEPWNTEEDFIQSALTLYAGWEKN